jgi:hypothetical protein
MLLSGAQANACAGDVQGLLTAVFQTLGKDCHAYDSLFADDAEYFHSHDGYKQKSELLDNCNGYGQFCPSGECVFQQDGEALVTEVNGHCHILAPYIWSETPANSKVPGNLEPHTGWEYIVARPQSGSEHGLLIKRFSEIETSYSLPYNWQTPEDTPALAQSTMDLLSQTKSQGECGSPLAPFITQDLSSSSDEQNLWRQQGSAVLLPIGGLCQVAVPFAAAVGGRLESGTIVYTLTPNVGAYSLNSKVVFSRRGAIQSSELLV